MQITWLPDVERRPRHVAVGEFDGVHLGHREVMRGADTVLTFEPHPRAVIAPDKAPLLLTSLAAKADLVAGLGDAYCLELRRTRIGPFDVADAGRFVPLSDALDFLPAVELEGDDARRAGHGVAVAATRHAGDEATVRLVDADGLIALAEPRSDGMLKPVVGFRG